MEKGLGKEIASENKYILQLYVSGMSPRSMEAIANIRRFCDKNLIGDFDLEIIDLNKNPEAAAREQIIFCPTLVKIAPLPRKMLIGTFSDGDKVLRGLGINYKKDL